MDMNYTSLKNFTLEVKITENNTRHLLDRLAEIEDSRNEKRNDIR